MAQIKSPVYVGNELLNCNTENKMIHLCQEFNPTAKKYDNGFISFSYPDDVTIKCKIDSSSSVNKQPVVKIFTKFKKSDLIKSLIGIGYRKEGKLYKKGNKHTQTQSIAEIDKNVINFTKIYNK